MYKRQSLTWYNMPYLKTTLKPDVPYIFRGRVVRKRGRLTMEQPEVYSPADYGKLLTALHPVYGQTKGLGNKACLLYTSRCV